MNRAIRLKPHRSQIVKILIVIAIILYGSAPCYPEEKQKKVRDSDGLFTEMAIITGFGSTNLPEGHYQPILLIGHLGIDLKKYFSALQNHDGHLTFFAEPQFNTVLKPDKDFEYGVGFGIQYSYPFMDRISVYLMGSVGPHYISVVSTRQANGFIWSDFLFRHLSNAHFATPNGGIDTNFAIVGYSIFFD